MSEPNPVRYLSNNASTLNRTSTTNKINDTLVDIGNNYLSNEKCSLYFKNNLRGDGNVTLNTF